MSAGHLHFAFRVAVIVARRDLVKFLRQPARVAAALGTAIMLWLLLGSGFAGEFRPAALGQTSYAAFMLPGAMTLVTVFASIFSSISIIDDRNEGWLQAAMVSPAPRWAVAMGKITGAAIVSFTQGAVLLTTLPLLDIHPSLGQIALAVAALAITSLAMTAMGTIFAWHSETTASFHAVMNIVFMPMWLLSGAFFPPSTDGAGVLTWLMRLNPLTWCTHAIRQPLLGEHATGSLLLACGFALAMFVGALSIMNRPPRIS